jgi:hypothetical protein
VLTADTDTTVLPPTHHRVAQATAALVLAAARKVRAAIRRGRKEYGDRSEPDLGSEEEPANHPPEHRRHGKRKTRTRRPHRTDTKQQNRSSASVGRQGLEP